MKKIKRALSVFIAGALAASLFAMPAFATSSAISPDSAASRMYTVDIYGGNNGTVNGENPYSVKVAAGQKVSFDDLVVALNSDVSNKYYVKGLRKASVNNAYTGKFVVQPSAVKQQSETSFALSGSMTITQDTDLVVAYGIKSQRVNYTVRYVDKDGNDIVPADTYVGDIGDSPAPVAKYIEGYLPRAMNTVLPALKGGEENVITFDYVKLDPTYRVIYENEVIRIITPEGEEITVTPVTPQAVEEAGGDIPIVNEAGEVILDDEGNPLAAPVDEVTLEDDDNPLASAGDIAAGDVEGITNPASMLTWLLPLLVGIVVAGLIAFFALLIRQKRKDEQQKSSSK